MNVFVCTEGCQEQIGYDFSKRVDSTQISSNDTEMTDMSIQDAKLRLLHWVNL